MAFAPSNVLMVREAVMFYYCPENSFDLVDPWALRRMLSELRATCQVNVLSTVRGPCQVRDSLPAAIVSALLAAPLLKS